MVTNLQTTQNETAFYTAILKNEANNPLPASQLVTLTLTFKDERTGIIINGRDNQDVLNTNNVVIDENGQLIWAMQTLDNPVLNLSNLYETHLALFTWSWSSGTRVGTQQIYIEVYQLGKSIGFSWINRIKKRMGVGRRCLDMDDEHWQEAAQQALDLFNHRLDRYVYEGHTGLTDPQGVIDFSTDSKILSVVNVDFLRPGILAGGTSLGGSLFFPLSNKDLAKTPPQSANRDLDIFNTLSNEPRASATGTPSSGGQNIETVNIGFGIGGAGGMGYGYGRPGGYGRWSFGDWYNWINQRVMIERITSIEPDWYWDREQKLLALYMPVGPYDVSILKAYDYDFSNLPPGYENMMLKAIEGFSRQILGDIIGRWGGTFPGPTGPTANDADYQHSRGQKLIEEVEADFKKLPISAGIFRG